MKWNSFIVLFIFCAQGNIGLAQFSLGKTLTAVKTVATNLKNRFLHLNVFDPDFTLFSIDDFLPLINDACSAAYELKLVRSVAPDDVEKMSVFVYTPEGKYEYQLIDAHKMLDLLIFSEIGSAAIAFTGWQGNLDDFDDMANAFGCAQTHIFIVVNSGIYIESVYDFATIDIEPVGILSSRFLMEPLRKRYPNMVIDLIGHGLGATCTYYAARTFRENTGAIVHRIMGLDTANSCSRYTNVLKRKDAETTINYNTNPYCFGQPEPIAMYNFYMYPVDDNQPACETGFCSHLIPIAYLTESVYPGYTEDFIGYECETVTQLKEGYCNGSRLAMGFSVDYTTVETSPNAIYLVYVNDDSPYGQNSKYNRVRCLPA